MLCSKCNQPIKPVVALDIDGTLGDYHLHFREFAEGWLGRKLPENYSGEMAHRDWVRSHWDIDLTTFRAIKLAYRQGGLKRSMPAYSDASNLTRALGLAGAEVWLTTTRPHERYDRVDPDTRAWTKRNEILYYGLIFEEHKYELLKEICGKDRVVGVLDDLPEELSRAASMFGDGTPILRRTEYNRAAIWPQAAETLGVAGAMLTDRVKKWNAKHGIPRPEMPEGVRWEGGVGVKS